jgi:hypothetical protein
MPNFTDGSTSNLQGNKINPPKVRMLPPREEQACACNIRLDHNCPICRCNQTEVIANSPQTPIMRNMIMMQA